MRMWAAGKKPDLVDRTEIAVRLGVGLSTVSRWQRRSILPEPDVRIGALEVWRWETIGEWAKDRSRFATRFRRPKAPDVVDLPGIAARLEIDSRTIDNWHRNDRLPTPDYRWEAGELWLWESVEEWSRTHLVRRGAGIDTQDDRQVVARHEPSGPRLQITGVENEPSVVDHRDRSAQVRPVATPQEPVESPPDPVKVTVARPRSSDPIGDLERLGAYFSDMAEAFRAS